MITGVVQASMFFIKTIYGYGKTLTIEYEGLGISIQDLKNQLQDKGFDPNDKLFWNYEDNETGFVENMELDLSLVDENRTLKIDHNLANAGIYKGKKLD